MISNHQMGSVTEVGHHGSIHENVSRARLALVAGVIAVGLAFGSNSPAVAQPNVGIGAYDPLELAPTFEEPMALKNAQFIGSIAFEYHNPNRRRQLIEVYQRSRGINWAPKKQTVNRLVASSISGTTDVATPADLAEGAVLFKSSQPNVLIIAHHNVTPIFAPLNVRGHRYNNRYIGSNAATQLGDHMTITRPLNIAGEKNVREYTYTAVATKIMTPDRINGFVEKSQRFKNTESNFAVTYSCWQPGTDSFRRLVVWHRDPNNGVETKPGTVYRLGSAQGKLTRIH